MIYFPEFFTTGFSFSNSLLEDVAENRNPLEEIKRMAKVHHLEILELLYVGNRLDIRL